MHIIWLSRLSALLAQETKLKTRRKQKQQLRVTHPVSSLYRAWPITQRIQKMFWGSWSPGVDSFIHPLLQKSSLARVGWTGHAGKQDGRHCGDSRRHYIRSSRLAPITRLQGPYYTSSSINRMPGPGMQTSAYHVILPPGAVASRGGDIEEPAVDIFHGERRICTAPPRIGQAPPPLYAQ